MEWRQIEGFDYEVSDTGRIRRIQHREVAVALCGVGKQYLRASLWRRGKCQRVLVHVLVARAFIGPCPPGHEHNHKDGNKTNNRPSNLEFVTRSQNQRHKFEVLGQTVNQGMAHGLAKLTDTEVIAIRERYARGEMQRVIAQDFNVTLGAIGLIVRGKRWKHLLPTHLRHHPVK